MCSCIASSMNIPITINKRVNRTVYRMLTCIIHESSMHHTTQDAEAAYQYQFAEFQQTTIYRWMDSWKLQNHSDKNL